ncbi:MAG: hypothetical protein FWG31_04180 [Oscillospiraceae bacterium]|nr:hypothetical protein [Oscillospiraceae bacterium]
MQAQVYEGYFQNGLFHTDGKTIRIPEGMQTYITVINKSISPKPDTWEELYKLTSEMTEDEKPRFEDFHRFTLGHKLIDFDEV